MASEAPRPTRRVVLAGGALALAAHAVPAICAPAAGRLHTVAIDGMQFSPATLTVRRGDRVVWVNRDPFPHTVTDEGVFDSHSIAAGARWTYAASRSGRFDYFCRLHPTMKATLVVEK